MLTRIAGLLLVVLGVGPNGIAGDALPIEQAHAHNDYEHVRPLFDALSHGFCSVEADIHLVDGKLLVAHDRAQVKPEKTLEALYLEPLRKRIETNGGTVYPHGPPFTLLIDIKSDAAQTYAALRPILEKYRTILTEFGTNKTTVKGVTIVLSGNRPVQLVAAEPSRLAGIDGRLNDLERAVSPHLMPVDQRQLAESFSLARAGRISSGRKSEAGGDRARRACTGASPPFLGDG